MTTVLVKGEQVTISMFDWLYENLDESKWRWSLAIINDHGEFYFDDEQDALMFQLKTGGHRRTKQEYTVEFINGIING